MKKPVITTLAVGQMAANCYIVSDSDTHEGIIIDPGDDPEYISDTLLKLHIRPVLVVATHGHFDHIMGAYALNLGFGIPFAIHPLDTFLVDRMEETAKHFLQVTYVDPAPSVGRKLANREVIAAGTVRLTVVHTPGHTPGSICLYEKHSGVLFTGDTIFSDGSVGRTDHSYASPLTLAASVRRILSYPAQTKLMPGHGEETTIGDEIGFHVQ
jgi:glyoxylase-like metal-dependent hydrolase (beta-lactamase superfamily II)